MNSDASTSLWPSRRGRILNRTAREASVFTGGDGGPALAEALITISPHGGQAAEIEEGHLTRDRRSRGTRGRALRMQRGHRCQVELSIIRYVYSNSSMKVRNRYPRSQ